MTLNYSQTSLEGYLSLTITICLALMASGSPLIGPHAMQIITLILAVLNAINRHFQTDAGKTVALVPGSDTPEVVPSHETPNDPSATPVVK